MIVSLVLFSLYSDIYIYIYYDIYSTGREYADMPYS